MEQPHEKFPTNFAKGKRYDSSPVRSTVNHCLILVFPSPKIPRLHLIGGRKTLGSVS